MKKIFALCLAGALAMAATACDDDDDKGGGNSGKMIVNGQTEEIKSVFYEERLGNRTTTDLYLFREAFAEFPEMQPEFCVIIRFSESLNGKTLDLTRPLDPNSHLYLVGWSDTSYVEVGYVDGTISDDHANPLAVTTGSLTLKRDGDRFTVKLSMTLDDGNTLAVDWAGKATIME